MADSPAPARATRRSRAIAAACFILAFAWMLDHGGCVYLLRPSGGTIRRQAYVHREGRDAATLTLSFQERGNCGTVIWTCASLSLDDRVFDTHVAEWRCLWVVIDGRPLDRAETNAWRPAAAEFFAAPHILQGDRNESQRLCMGYPLELLGALAAVIMR